VTAGDGREASQESGLGAQTATGRAPAEGDVEESGADTVGEDAGGEQNPKGGS
jgi:hypothetical protein